MCVHACLSPVYFRSSLRRKVVHSLRTNNHLSYGRHGIMVPSLNFDSEGISYKSARNERSALNSFSDVRQVTAIRHRSTMRKGLLLITVLSAISLREILGKPTEIATSSDALEPVALAANNSSKEGRYTCNYTFINIAKKYLFLRTIS